jgi:hypothetical protein
VHRVWAGAECADDAAEVFGERKKHAQSGKICGPIANGFQLWRAVVHCLAPLLWWIVTALNRRSKLPLILEGNPTPERCSARAKVHQYRLGRRRVTVVPIFDKLFVGPTPPVASPPYRSPDEPAGDRSPRKNDLPKVPSGSPGRSWQRNDRAINVVAIGSHAPPQRAFLNEAVRCSATAGKTVQARISSRLHNCCRSLGVT